MRLTLRFIAVFIFAFGVCQGKSINGNSTGASNSSYLFPTDASRQINSGFADYRATHFHAGIDISTNGKIGYPVYAAKSGYVYRVSVSPFGYGKMVVLRHDDSTFTLYGHLSGFSKEIQGRVEAAQESEEKYGVNLKFQPGEIKVNRGEVIAFTGATGVGGPHLHFEIRDENFSPIDPLIYKSLDVPHYKLPRIFDVAVRGFQTGSVQMSRVQKAKGEYEASRVFHLDQPFYFVVHAADSYGRGMFKRPPKHIQLRIDGKDFISVNLTHIDIGDYLDVGSLVDLDLSRGYKTYYDLCVDRAIPFSVFTPSFPLSGLVDRNFSNGIHTYEISVADENGDYASVTGKFVLDIPRSNITAKGSLEHASVTIAPFEEKIIKPSPSLTLKFPANCFVKYIGVDAKRLSADSFVIEPTGKPLRKKIQVTRKVDDPKLQLFRKLKNRWSYIPCDNDGKVLTGEIGYKTGEFALLRDNEPPTVGKIRVSKKNPFYRSVAPNEFNRVFVYFKVADRLSGIDTDDILLKVGRRKYLCEYDVDKHAAICKVDAGLLRREKKVEVVVRDHAGNERSVVSRARF